MVPVLQELRKKLSPGSFTFRSSRQEHVSLSPDDQAMQDRLKPLVKAFKLRTLAELKVLPSVLDCTSALELDALLVCRSF